MRNQILILFIGLLLSPAAWCEDDAAAILKAAKTAFAEAVALEGGWTSTQDLIKESEKLLSSGAKDQALPLARQARQEAELSRERARALKDSWSVPKYLSKP